MGTELDIHNLIGRYCDAVLRVDVLLFADTWADEARWLIPGDGTIEGRRAITEAFERIRPSYLQCVQEILNGTIAYADGETARAQWQIRELQWRADGSITQLIGVYHDAMERGGDGVLRFTQREFELIYSGPIDGTGRLRSPRP